MTRELRTLLSGLSAARTPAPLASCFHLRKRAERIWYPERRPSSIFITVNKSQTNKVFPSALIYTPENTFHPQTDCEWSVHGLHIHCSEVQLGKHPQSSGLNSQHRSSHQTDVWARSMGRTVRFPKVWLLSPRSGKMCGQPFVLLFGPTSKGNIDILFFLLLQTA